MPWKETSPVEEREKFVLEWFRGSVPKSHLCTKYGISRKTGYKWVERFLEGGRLALTDQSRGPKHHPNRTPAEVEELIVKLRKAHPTWGPKKLRRLLLEADKPTPATSTIGRILADHHLVFRRRRKRRVLESQVQLEKPKVPNDVWAADFKGEFRTGNGRYVYPLTVSDGVSRYLLACEGKESTSIKPSMATFEALFEEFGMPDRMRTDNGVPFASKGIAGLSRLSLWWLKLGIWHERIRKGKPQDNGRHERIHRTLKAETTRPPAYNLESQQELFDAFKYEYNNERPHEALDFATPASVYRPSSRTYTGAPEPFEYPAHLETRKVSSKGTFCWKGQHIFLSEVLRGEHVGFMAIDDDLWEIQVGPLIVSHFDVRAGKTTAAPQPNVAAEYSAESSPTNERL